MKNTFSSSALTVLFVGIVAAIIFFVNKNSVVKDTSNMITVGVSPDFPPFEFMENGELAGFEVELIKEVGTRMNKTIHLKAMPFTTLLPSLQLGSLDVVVSGLTSTPERAQQVLFSKPYIDHDPFVIVSLRASQAQTVDDLKGKEVAVCEGHTADIHMSKIEGPILTRLKSVYDAFVALKGGRAYAFVVAAKTAKPFFDKHGKEAFNVAEIAGTSENTALAVTKGKPELLKEIQVVLDAMQADGSLQNLRTKWGI